MKRFILLWMIILVHCGNAVAGDLPKHIKLTTDYESQVITVSRGDYISIKANHWSSVINSLDHTPWIRTYPLRDHDMLVFKILGDGGISFYHGVGQQQRLFRVKLLVR